MNPTRLLGALTLATGGSLLLSEPLIGQELMAELTGNAPMALQPICAIAIVLGALAIVLGVREDKEFNHSRGGTDR
ncbi:MAG: hypothetical protein ACRERD_22205 [Candidatus Binatia bacterium]